MGSFNPISGELAGITEDLRLRLQSALMAVDSLDQKVPRSHLGPPQAAEARRMLRERRDRDKFFPENLFADPAWDMLLELYAAELCQTRLSTTSLCAGSAVPQTTALRWITTLENEGLILRRTDPLDRRRVFVGLTQKGIGCMKSFLENNARKRSPHT